MKKKRSIPLANGHVNPFLISDNTTPMMACFNPLGFFEIFNANNNHVEILFPGIPISHEATTEFEITLSSSNKRKKK